MEMQYPSDKRLGMARSLTGAWLSLAWRGRGGVGKRAMLQYGVSEGAARRAGGRGRGRGRAGKWLERQDGWDRGGWAKQTGTGRRNAGGLGGCLS